MRAKHAASLLAMTAAIGIATILAMNSIDARDAAPPHSHHHDQHAAGIDDFRRRVTATPLTVELLRELDVLCSDATVDQIEHALNRGDSVSPDDAHAIRCLRAVQWFRELAPLVSHADRLAVLLARGTDSDVFSAAQILMREEVSERYLAALASLSVDDRPLVRLLAARLAHVASLIGGPSKTCDVIACNSLVDRDVDVCAAFAATDAADMASATVMNCLISRIDDSRPLVIGRRDRFGFGAVHGTLGEHMSYHLGVAILRYDRHARVELGALGVPAAESLRRWWKSERSAWRGGLSNTQFDCVFNGVVRLDPGTSAHVRTESGRDLEISLVSYAEGTSSDAWPYHSYVIRCKSRGPAGSTGGGSEFGPDAPEQDIECIARSTSFGFHARTVEGDQFGALRVLESIVAPTTGTTARVWMRLSVRRD